MIATVPFDPALLETEPESVTRERNDSFEWGVKSVCAVRNDDFLLDPEFEPYTPTGGRLDRFTAEYDDMAVYVTLLKSGVLLGYEFLIFDAKHPTLSAERLYLTRKHSALRRLDLERLDVEDGVTYLVGANDGHANFYHWNFQCLPGILLLRNVARARGLDYRIVLPPLDELRRRALALAGIEQTECVTLDPHCFLQNVPLLYSTVTCGHYAFQPSARLIDQMNHYRENCLKHSNATLPTRFYVSRRDATRNRGIENEAELLQALKNTGHEELVMSSLSIEDQVAAFAYAESIVAPHGAGLVNLMFSPATARLVEILPENYRMAYFFRIAQVRGMGYSQVLSRVTDAWDGKDVHNCPVRVDVSKVLTMLERSEEFRVQRAA